MPNQLAPNHVPFTFAQIREATGARLDGEGETIGVVTDSRQVAANNLFVALKGEKFDANHFIPEVQAQGAVALGEKHVADTQKALGDLARFHRNRFQIPIIAVTGSYGKTTTRALIHAALGAKFQTLTSQGNFNNEIGLPMTLLQVENQHEAAVLEMGMRGRGQIEYLAQIALPTVGVITNIGPQHIELLGSLEEIAAAKAELLESLPENGLAVLPADSPFLEFLKSKAKCRVVTFGTSEIADYRATEIETQSDGSLQFKIQNSKFKIPFPGAHNAINAAAALAVAHQLGVAVSDAAYSLESAAIPGSRMRILKTKNLTVIDDCYNAGPDSMRAALETLLDFPGSGRRVAVLGAMKELGDFSEAEHRKIGALAGQFVEVLVGVGGETRPLLNAALESAKQNETELAVSWCENAEEAAGRIEEWILAGDVVLVKGSRSVGLEVVVEAMEVVAA